MKRKIKVATTSLAGCFGCHMSLLDIDERIGELIELVDFDRCPLTDIKDLSECDLGIVEGAVANADNVQVLQDFRAHCSTLVAIGACAIDGGIPAMRNQFDLSTCLTESYVDGIGVYNAGIPNDPELPLLLRRVYPVAEVVRIDHFLPGCPPSAEVIWGFLTDFSTGTTTGVPNRHIRFD